MQQYLATLVETITSNTETRLCLTTTFHKSFHQYATTMKQKLKAKVACRMAAKQLLHQVLNIRKAKAGNLLKQIHAIATQNITSKDDFGVKCHTPANELFFL